MGLNWREWTKREGAIIIAQPAVVKQGYIVNLEGVVLRMYVRVEEDGIFMELVHTYAITNTLKVNLDPRRVSDPQELTDLFTESINNVNEESSVGSLLMRRTLTTQDVLAGRSMKGRGYESRLRAIGELGDVSPTQEDVAVGLKVSLDKLERLIRDSAFHVQSLANEQGWGQFSDSTLDYLVRYCTVSFEEGLMDG